MKHHNMLPFRAAVAALPVFVARTSAQAASGLSQEYCSYQNTGSDYQAVNNIYQSNGACFTQCAENYAFAVVQWQNCWCSNYIPAAQSSTSDCNQKCPGYPSDLCGNQSKGLYGYIKLRNQPSGTGGASSSEASSTPASTSSSPPTTSSPPPSTSSSPPPSSTQEPETSTVSQTIRQTVTQSPSPSTVVSFVTLTPSTSSTTPTTTSIPTTSSTSSTPPPPPSSTSTTSSSTIPPPVIAPVTTPSPTSTPTTSPTPSPVTSTRVVTVSGAVVTQTVTTTPLVYPSAEASSETPTASLSAGAIAGIVLGLLAALAILALAAFLLWRRRKQNRPPFSHHGSPQMTTAGVGPSPRRNVSVLSKAGLLSRAHQPDSSTDPDESFHHHHSASARHSLFYPLEGVSPDSPLDETRRYSRPMVYDQRLNPSALFANSEANGSRVSMQDGADYSRPLDGGLGGRTLGIANPDPRASFESRC